MGVAYSARMGRKATGGLALAVAIGLTASSVASGSPFFESSGSAGHQGHVSTARAPITAVFRHRGEVVGDRNSFVQMRLVRRGEDRFTIRDFKAKRVVGRCAGHRDRIKLSIDGTLTSRPGTHFRYRVKSGTGGGALVLSGRIVRSGRTVIGHMKTGRFDAGGVFCRVPPKEFRTRSIPQGYSNRGSR